MQIIKNKISDMILNKSIHFFIINYVSINYLEKDFFMSLTTKYP